MPVKICPQCNTTYDLNQSFCPNDGAALRVQSGDGDLTGRIFSDRYRLIRKLGGGGMGNVYLAEHVRLRSLAAVKVIRSAMAADSGAAARFNREAQNASLINHGNVAKVFDFGEADGMMFLAMEYVDGQPLSALIDEGPVNPGRASRIVFQIADALAAAHKLAIIHRDLKPDNIMLGKGPEGDDDVKLVDFGISKVPTADDQKITVDGTVIGTPAYMSPEQASGKIDLDARSDIYSLGVVAYQMLTGKLPFQGETSQEQILSRLMHPAAKLAEARPDLPWAPSLERALARSMASDPNERYQTALDFARDFQKAVRASVPTLGATVAIGVDQMATQPHLATTKPEIPPARTGPLAQHAVTQPAATSPHGATKSRSLLYAGGGAVATAAVIAAFLLLKTPPTRPNPPKADSPTVAHGTDTSGASQQGKTESSKTNTNNSRTDTKRGDGANTKHSGGDKPVPDKSVADKVPNKIPNAGTGSVTPPPQQPTDTAKGKTSVVDQNVKHNDPAPKESTKTVVAPPPVDLSADIQKLKETVAANDRTEADYRAAFDKGTSLLRVARVTSDSVRIMYYQAQALVQLSDTPGACRVLTKTATIAAGTPLAGAVSRTAQQIGCP